MCIETVFTAYKAWLVHREYSPATIEKYTRALRRFFADTAATPAPDRETVAAWRDALAAKGYTPATVNSMLAAVNDYQESIDNPAGKAKPLKRQRRVFCDADRELSRAEYFRQGYRQQAHAAAVANAVLYRHPRVGTALYHGRSFAAAQSFHPLQREVP